MKHINYIATIGLAAISLVACQSEADEIAPQQFTVGEADNAIVLRAGVSEHGMGAQTRAVEKTYVAFKEGTKLALSVNGTWTGHAPETITESTTGTTDADSDDDKKNVVALSPVVYWDDFGTADPDNIGADKGRAKGLTIYGAAIDGIKSAAPTVSDWENISWALLADQTSGWTNKDLLTSNNISGTATYRFDDVRVVGGNPNNLLVFTHAMSKITVVLTAGEGFSGWSTDSPNAGTFTGAPTVTLKNFKYTGSVNVKTKVSDPAADVSDIQMHLLSGGASGHTATFDALVYPDNEFVDATEILTLTADGNTFKVTAAQLNTAIQTAITNVETTGYPGTDNKLQQGWNYKIQIRVNKTKVQVLATIVDWEDVIAAEVTPKINITTAYGIEANGTTEKAFIQPFDFFHSTAIGSGYSKDATITYNSGTSKYDFSTPLYWPTHNTHYFFRGVYPKVGDAPLTPSDKFSTSTSDASVIAVENVAYESGKYPSDLAIGYPRTKTEKCTHNNEVATSGICATEGDIRMNFRYVMSQVEVKLETVSGDAAVTIDENTTIKIVGGYTSAKIKLEDGGADVSGKSVQDWLMLGGTYNDRLDAVIPQTLADMKFVITVKNSDATLDTYECKIADIKENTTGTKITTWQSGKKYIYTLKMQKTGVSTVATIADWESVDASENVWF